MRNTCCNILPSTGCRISFLKRWRGKLVWCCSIQSQILLENAVAVGWRRERRSGNRSLPSVGADLKPNLVPEVSIRSVRPILKGHKPTRTTTCSHQISGLPIAVVTSTWGSLHSLKLYCGGAGAKDQADPIKWTATAAVRMQ